MSLLNNLLNKNINDDLKFEKEFEMNEIFNKFKNYQNFSKNTVKIEPTTNITIINNNTEIDFNITNRNYDLLGNLNLYIELKNNNILNLFELIEFIEIKIGNINIEKINPDILNIYFNIYKNINNKKIFNTISYVNSNVIYIPILFYFMLEYSNYIPLYLLYFNDIIIKIKFKNKKNLELNNSNIYLITNFIKLDQKYIEYIKYNSIVKENISKIFKWNIEVFKEIKNQDLKCTIDNIPKKNCIKLKINNLITHIILKIENVNIDNIILYINNTTLKYTSKELKFLTVLNTNFNMNNLNSLYLINFGIFKQKLSGFVNFDLINNLNIELMSKNNDNINITFSENKMNIANTLNSIIIERPNIIYSKIPGQSPNLFLTKNITYNILNNNIDIIITNNNPKNTNILSLELYNGFNDINKTLIIQEDINILYYTNRNNTLISGEIYINNTNEGDYSLSIGTCKTYIIEYNEYSIFNGQLLN